VHHVGHSPRSSIAVQTEGKRAIVDLTTFRSSFYPTFQLFKESFRYHACLPPLISLHLW